MLKMTSRSVLLGLVTLFGIVSCQVTYSDLAGVWTTGDSETGCRTDIQFLYKNYVSYNTGDKCDAIGAFLGTYAISDDIIFVQFCSVPDGFGLSFIAYGIEIDETNTLKLYTLDESQEPSTLVLSATKSDPRAFDGVYSGTLAKDSATVRTQFDSGLYLSYTMPNEDVSGTLPFYGRIDTSDFDSSKYQIIFADFNDNSFGGAYTPSDGVVFENVTITTGDNTLTVDSEDAISTFTVSYVERASDVFEGVWTGFNSPCYTTVQFTTGLFRSYNIGGSDCTNQAFLGVYNVVSNTQIRVGYARSTISSFEGASLLIDYDFSEDGNTLNLTGTVLGSTSTFFLSLTKIVAPPEAVLARLRLDGTLDDNFDADSLIADLSEATGLPSSQFEVISLQNGSIIVNFAMIDDQAAQITASDSFRTLAEQTSIGGFNILEVTAVTGLTEDTTTSPTPGGSGAVATFQISIALLLAIAIAIVFA